MLATTACRAAKSLQLVEPASNSLPKPVWPGLVGSKQNKQYTHLFLACVCVHTTGWQQRQFHAAAAAASWKLADWPACSTHPTQQQACIAAQASGSCWLMQARDKPHVSHSVPKQQRQQQEQEQKPETTHDSTCSCSSS